VYNGKHLLPNELTLDDVDWIYYNFYRHAEELGAEALGIHSHQEFDPIMTTLFYYYKNVLDINEKHMDYLYDVPSVETIVDGRKIVVFFGNKYIRICTKLKYARVTSVFGQNHYQLSHTTHELNSIIIHDPMLRKIFTDCIATIQQGIWNNPIYMFNDHSADLDLNDKCEIITDIYTSRAGPEFAGLEQFSVCAVPTVHTNCSGLLYNTDVVIHQWGGDTKTVKVTYEQKSSDGTVVNNSTSYYEGGKKIEGMTIRPDGKFTVDVLDPEQYNITGIIGYKVVKNGAHQVVVVLDVPKTSLIDTGDHIKYRTNRAKVVDMFVPQFDKCKKCQLMTAFYDTSKKEFRCSKHISGMRSTSMVARCRVTEGYSALRDSTYKYTVGQDAIPTNGGFDARRRSCGVGIHFCKEYNVLAKYISFSYVNHPLGDIVPKAECSVASKVPNVLDVPEIPNSPEILNVSEIPNAHEIPKAHDVYEIPKASEIPNAYIDHSAPETDPICAICHDEYGNEGVNLQCGHVFHSRCINNWKVINNTCPICREVLTQNKRSCVLM
jgi:hypothetical protein